ncbi:hypothetical protein DERP_010303 [Dermatophagoides pteronyssinus]|uniref:Uncharacterized protein n=1 Tax=Dermatophagoides pteronyssinus TaxID=6956 RepID=A0ABQ8IYQ5_DERPT|nr:hypothetical protein DERP_010303 [Dermatophagoides pteronyssinus]
MESIGQFDVRVQFELIFYTAKHISGKYLDSQKTSQRNIFSILADWRQMSAKRKRNSPKQNVMTPIQVVILILTALPFDIYY